MKKFLFEAGITVFVLGVIAVLAMPYFFLEEENPSEKSSDQMTEENLENSGNSEKKLPNTVLETQKNNSEVVLYFDLACDHCRDFYKNTFAKFWKEKKESSFPFVFQHFPTQTVGVGMEAAKFFECAKKQGKTEKELLDFFYFANDSINPSDQKNWEQTLALDGETMKMCQELPETTEKIVAERNSAKEKGIRGTPSVMISGRIFEGKVRPEILHSVIEN